MTALMTTSTSAEQWRVVCDIPCYEVSDRGRVRRIGAEEPLQPKVTGKSPYQYVSLCWYGSEHYKTIHRLVAIAFIANPDNKPLVDHINGIHTDNRVANLRWVTRSENQYNRRTKAAYKGVSWNTRSGKWYAQIRVDDKTIYIGHYDDPEEAYYAYCAAAVLYHGEYACG